MAHPLRAVVMLVILGCVSAGAYGQEQPVQEPDQPAAPATEFTVGKAVALVGICLAAAVAAVGGGYSLSRIGSNCIESMARQPEAAGSMFAPMFVAAAMVEGGMLFAIVVCILGVLLKI